MTKCHLWQLVQPPVTVSPPTVCRKIGSKCYNFPGGMNVELARVGHVPSYVFWSISCRFCPFFCQVLWLLWFVFCFFNAVSWDVSVSLFGLFFSCCQLFPFLCLVRFQWHPSQGFSSGPDLVVPFMYGTVSVWSPPSTAPHSQEPVIFQNMTWGSRARPVLEDSCHLRQGGP